MLGVARLVPGCGRAALIVHAHDSTSVSARGEARRNLRRVLVSVAATISRSSRAWLVRQQARGRHAGDHAPGGQRLDHRRGRPWAASDGEFVEEGGGHQLDALAAPPADPPARDALAWLSRARRVSPSSPSSDRWMVKARQHRPELVQMLLVAFSRRICCSRVDKRQHIAALAFGIHRLAAQPAGHLAQEFLARGEQPDIGSAEIQAVADATGLPPPRCRRPARPAVPAGPARRPRSPPRSAARPWHGRPRRWAAGRGSGRTRPGSAPPRRRSRSSIRRDDVFGAAGRHRRAHDRARTGWRRFPPSRHNADAGRRTGSPCRAW